MEENIINHNSGTIIINGGNPLEGCPTDWDEAHAWIEKANEGKEDYEPRWSFDCGFKLDFDGPLLRISSRFYPPRTHQGPTWDGTLSVRFMEKDVIEKKFDCKTLEDLKAQVEEYVKNLIKDIEAALYSIK